MSDDSDVLTRLVAYHDHIAAPPALVVDDVCRGRRRVRRNRALVSGSVAVAVAAVVAAAALLAGTSWDAAPQPAAPTPTPTTSLPRVNGEISGAAQHFRAPVGDYDWRGYDPRTDRGLFVSEGQCESCFDRAGSLTVVSRTGTVTKLTCGTDLTCRGLTGSSTLVAALGPGSDEVTVALRERALQVIAYDGTVRRTLDLTKALAPGEGINNVVWRHDGRALAILTGQATGGATVTRVRLVDEKGSAQLAYSLMSYHAGKGVPPLTLDPTDHDGRGSVWALGGWSPDGSVLLLDVLMSSRSLGSGPRVVALRLQPPGAARPATAHVLYASDRHFDWAGSVAWSPDGTRVAVRRLNQIVEISPDDGRVLARHPHVDGWLIWPRAAR